MGRRRDAREREEEGEGEMRDGESETRVSARAVGLSTVYRMNKQENHNFTIAEWELSSSTRGLAARFVRNTLIMECLFWSRRCCGMVDTDYKVFTIEGVKWRPRAKQTATRPLQARQAARWIPCVAVIAGPFSALAGSLGGVMKQNERLWDHTSSILQAQ